MQLFIPHILVWGSCFLLCIPSALPTGPRLPPPPRQLLTQLCHTRNLLTHNSFTHNFLTHHSPTHNLITHTHTALSHTTYSHTTCPRNFFTHRLPAHNFVAQLFHTQPTHTLAQKYLIELLMWNASHVQKHLS